MEEKQFYEENSGAAGADSLIKVTGMYKDWFLDYASYVILERAVPAISDGLKVWIMGIGCIRLCEKKKSKKKKKKKKSSMKKSKYICKNLNNK